MVKGLSSKLSVPGTSGFYRYIGRGRWLKDNTTAITKKCIIHVLAETARAASCGVP